MQMVNNGLPSEVTSGEEVREAAAQHSRRPVQGVLTLGRRTARLTASTGLAGSLALAGLMGSTALPGGMAQAQLVDFCSGLSLNESVLRDRLIPLLQAVVNPIEATVDPLVSNLGTVVGTLTAPLPVVGQILSPTGLLPVTALNLNVGTILGQVQAGQPLGIQVAGPNGQILGPGADCDILADSFQLDGTQGISIGGNSISGLGSGTATPAVARTVDSIAFGDNAQTGLGSTGAVALGTNANVGATAVGGIALGNAASVGASATGAIALGNGATAGGANSLALGAGTTVAQANSIALGAGSTTTRGAQPAYGAIGLGAGQASTGEVAIGGRTLTGLAPGTLTGDAVNVAQLSSVANAVGSTAGALGGGASYNPATGVFTPPSFTVQGAPRPTVGAALTALDGQVSTNTTNITNLTNGTVGLVQQLAAGGPITVGAGVGGTVVGLAGISGPRTVTGVAGGVVAAGSAQAVNGAQLFATNIAVGALNTGLAGTADAIGGGASFDPLTGVLTAPAFVLNSATGTGTDIFDNVGDALGNLDGRTLDNTTNITNLTNNIDSGAIGLVQQATAASPITVAATTGGTSVGFAGNAGARVLTGVGAGAVNAASADAVTGAQLFATNTTLGTLGAGTAASLGAGASFDPATGAFTPPAFVLNAVSGIGTETFATVDGALGNLDDRTQENTTNITNIANGTVGLVQQIAAGGPITVGAGVGGTTVSISGTGGVRTLTGLGAGLVTDTSTDAVTGAQLFATNTAVLGLNTGVAGTAGALGAGASYDPNTGVFAPPAFVLNAVSGVGTETFATVDGALGNLDDRTLVNTTNITNLANGTVGLVQQVAVGGPITVGAGVGGTIVSVAGTAGVRTLTGVAEGDLTAVSTEAVTGAQLFATNTAVGTLGAGTAAALGAGASFDPVTGAFTPPSFSLEGGTVVEATVGGAISNLDTRTTDLAGQIGSGTIGLVQQLDPAGPITVAAATGGTLVNFAGTAGPRALTGVAEGAVALGSTDVVIGAQLFATNELVGDLGVGLGAAATAFGGGASFDPLTGTFSPPEYILAAANGIGTETFATVGDALGNLDGRTLENTTDITELTTNIETGAVGLVRQGPDGTVTIAGLTGGATVDIGGTDGVRTLTGLADGDLTAVSADAVTGGQLFATNAAVGTLNTGLTNTAALIGAGTAYDPATGTFSPPSFVLEGGTVIETTVGGAIVNLDARTTILAGQIGSGAIGLVQQADPADPITVGAATGGALVNFAGTAGPRVLTGLGTGTVAAGSTDAVTGAQLFATNTTVATLGTGLAGTAGALGGGASFDPATGAFTPPAYLVQGAVRTDVGTALSALDGQVTVNTTDIANLQVQVGQAGVGLVQQAAPGADLTVGVNTDGDAVRFNQTGGETRLVTGLTDGAVAAGSTDAVTGNQAFATTTSIASALGGGAAVAADGTVTAPTYSIGGTGFTDAGSAFAALDTSVTALQNQVGALDPGGNLAFVSVNTTQGPARATGTETVAIGGGAVASGANSSAYGSGATATGAGSSAFGAGASAAFDNSSAFGAGASATRANQMVFGTASNTYTMPGVTSAASRAAQSGPVDLVTTDAAGNLASLPLSDFFSGVSAIEGELARMDRKFDRQSDGIAIAMALGAVALPADKTFALTGSVGYFDNTAAFGLGAVGQIADNWYLNGGVGVGTERGTVAGRAGLTYAW